VKNDVVVELKDIRKEFPGVVALDRVNMKIKAGRVHALVGENGAGKSTLMKILSGSYGQYEGQIILDGEVTFFRSEKDALNKGIAIVSQELNYAPELTITEHVFLGREITDRFGFLRKKEMIRKTKEFLSYMNLDYDPETPMKKLSVAQRQMIEILKAISRNGRIIIMDEPTSALTSVETEIFFDKVKQLKENGIAFVFITHRLEEVFAIGDDYTVLRDGHHVGSGLISEVTMDDLITKMVGRDIEDIYPPLPGHKQDIVLECRNLYSEGVFSDISFYVREGEILGFAGMMGAGRSEIARAVFGMDKLDKGTILINNKEHKIKSIQDAMKLGMAMVMEDRAAYGFVGVRSIRDNVVLPNSNLYIKNGFIQKKKVADDVNKLIERLSIKAPGMETLVGTLSGGNQQKVVLGKWLVRNPKILILDEPTRGIDVGAKQEIYQLIIQLAKSGMAILLISSEMSEVISMSHRIMVIADGRVAGELKKEEATQDKIMRMIMEEGAKNA
jgi:ABC-type sugar transport system ATPase subunit